MPLKSIDIFVKVVQSGNFNKAAKALNLPNSTVSVRVAELEKSLGVTLIQRTTRKVTITKEGQAFYERCSRALEEIDLARQEASRSSIEPTGILKITAPVDIGQTIAPVLVAHYLRKYPHMEVDLIVTNHTLDLVAEGIDIAVRIGNLPDSSMKARKLGEATLRLWAGPEYIKEHGMPTHPKELADHNLIGFIPLKNGTMTLTNKKKSFPLKMNSKICSDDPQATKMLIAQNLGIGFSTGFHVSKEVRDGLLVPVLEDWIYRKVALSLIYPGQKFAPAKVSTFLDLASEEFKKMDVFNT